MARGTLRVYLGAAPGVGKTYAMLDEGRRRRERGTDVVVGFVETHGRAHTAEQIDGLEVVPRRQLDVPRHDASRRWTSTRSSPASPQVALVDELAHTNVPGLAQREALAGRRGAARRRHRRDLDRQHPAPRVAQRRRRADHRGARSARRSPTRSCARADQIELVDMTPEALRRRMAHGNIYPAEKVDAALGNYFRAGQPHRAARAGAAVGGRPGRRGARSDYRERHGIDRPWETRERVVVALTGGPEGETLDPPGRADRRARRSGDLHRPCTSRRSDGLAGAGPTRARRASARSSSELGGDVPPGRRRRRRRGAGRRSPAAENATQLVLGASRRSRWRELDAGLGHQPRDPRLGATSTSTSSATTTPRGDAAARPRRRRPTRCRRAGVVAGAVARRPSLLAAARPCVLATCATTSACRASCCSTCSLVVVVAAIGGVWPALGGRGRRLPARQLVLHPAAPHVHHRRGREPARARRLRRRRRRRSARSSSSPRGAPPRRAARARRGRDAAPGSAATLVGERRAASMLEPLRDVRRSTASPCCAPRRAERGSSTPVGRTRRPRRRTTATPSRVDAAHDARRSSAPALAADDQRLLDAFAAQLAALAPASTSSQAEAAEAGDARRGQRRCAPRCSPPCRTTCAPRWPAIKASVTQPAQRRHRLDARASATSCSRPIDDEADRLDALVGNLLDMSRLQTGALDVSAAPGRPRRGRAGGARQPRRRAADASTSTSPETCPRVVADPACSSGRSPTSSPTRSRHAAGAAASGSSPARSAAASSCGSSTAAPASRRPSASAIFQPFQRLGDAPRRRRRPRPRRRARLRRGDGRRARARGHPRRRAHHGHQRCRAATR